MNWIRSSWAAVLCDYMALCAIRALSGLPAFGGEEKRKEKSHFIYTELCKEPSWLTFHIPVPAGQYDFINVYDMAYFLMQLRPSERIHLHF